jgi:orotidine-5'-phosphate decarboxylase
MAELVVALDVMDAATALWVVERLGDDVRWYKIGAMLYTAGGPAVVREIGARGGRVFLDLKWHDIPAQVGGAVAAAVELGVALATVHLAGGREMLEWAVRAAAGKLKLVGVGVLTSLDAPAYSEAVGRPVDDLEAELLRLARFGMAAGLDGVVASPREVRRLRAELGPGALLVVPGIRRATDASGDQVRTATPAEAVADGADLLVVGRPIIGASDVRAAARGLLGEMGR